jgi:hypothetical protein
MQDKSEALSKPLVWEAVKMRSGDSYFTACMDFNRDHTYTVYPMPEGTCRATRSAGRFLGEYGSTELAQSACQADREACLRSMMVEGGHKAFCAEFPLPPEIAAQREEAIAKMRVPDGVTPKPPVLSEAAMAFKRGLSK